MVNNLQENSIYLFTDHDLDGAGCYFLLRTYIGNDFNLKQTSEKRFTEDFNSLNNKDSYKKIYIFDLDIIKDHVDIIDLNNVVYMHHRNLEGSSIIKTQHLRNESDECTSCTKLLYTKLKDKLKTPLTNEQKSLIALIDDYDSYNLKSPNSLKLNYFYWSFKYDKAQKFYENFKEGFYGFSNYQNKIVSDCEEKFNTIYKNLKIFKGEIDVGGQKLVICSTFNSFSPSEICHKIINDHKCDVVINVNLNTNYLNIRKNPNCTLHLGNFAKKLFDGGGDLKVAGGHLNKNFLVLSKQLYPIT